MSEVKSPVWAFFAKLIGFGASAMIASSLTKCGATLIIPAEGFAVKDTKGPLQEGELERAAAWAEQVARR